MARKSKGKKPAETMRQRQQRLLREQRARKAAKTKPVKASSSTPTSTRVEKVKVKVEGQRQLPPSKSANGALPPGQRGGAVSTGNRARRRNVTTNPPKGTQMGTRGGGAKAQLRLPPASIRSAGAVSKALSKTGAVAGRVSLPLAAYSTAKDLKDSLDRGEGYARVPGLVRRLAQGNGRNRTSGSGTNRRGRRTGTAPASNTSSTPTQSRSRGMSNIPPSEGSRNNPNYGKPGNPTSASKPASSSKPTPSNNSNPPAQTTKSKQKSKGDRMEKASSSDRMAAWAKANRKMIEKSGTKKQKALLAKVLKKKNESSTRSAQNSTGRSQLSNANRNTG